MLIPQYSLRWLFGLTAVCAVISLITASALRGQGWAIGVTIGLVSLLVVIGVHVLLFAAVWLYSKLLARGGNPFAPAAAAKTTPAKNEN